MLEFQISLLAAKLATALMNTALSSDGVQQVQTKTRKDRLQKGIVIASHIWGRMVNPGDNRSSRTTSVDKRKAIVIHFVDEDSFVSTIFPDISAKHEINGKWFVKNISK